MKLKRIYGIIYLKQQNIVRRLLYKKKNTSRQKKL